jgi:hypothetical protein
LQPTWFQHGIGNAHERAGRTEGALAKRYLPLNSDVPAGLPVNVDDPQLAQGVLWSTLRAEDEGVADPEGQWAAGVIGPPEEALVASRLLTGPLARPVGLSAARVS